MFLRYTLFSLLVAFPLGAKDVAPERLLPSTTQVYLRWDGVRAHREAYAQSAQGRILAGQTGKLFHDVWKRIARQMKAEGPGDALLNGASSGEVIRQHAQVNALARLPEVLLDHGVVLGMELQFLPDLDSAIDKIRVLATGGEFEDTLSPMFQITCIFPGAANRYELQELMKLADQKDSGIKQMQSHGRTLYFAEQGDDTLQYMWWKEGSHFVLVGSTLPPKRAVRRVFDAGSGITEMPLFRELERFDKFEVTTRGFIDGKALGDRLRLAVIAEPLAGVVLEELGLFDIGAIRFLEGFDGKESRSVVRADIAKEHRGITKVFVPKTFRWQDDLTPLPADAHRWIMGKTDLTALYDIFLSYLVVQDLDAAGFRNPKHVFREKKEEYVREIDALAGIKVGEIFGALDDTFLTYHSPSDGLPSLGQVLAVRVKDERIVTRHLDQLGRKLVEATDGELLFRIRPCHGASIREFIVRDTSPVTVAYTIHKGWLVIALHPQPVRGFVLRSEGKLPKWKPDPVLAKRLAKLPKECGMVQVIDPRPSVRLLLSAAPLLAGLLGELNEGDPLFEAGMLPHAGEVCNELFPNLLWSNFDGKTMHWESHDSLVLPLQSIGMEWLPLLNFAGALF